MLLLERGGKCNPIQNCKELIPLKEPSGYYWLEFSNELVQVYCDMQTDGG